MNARDILGKLATKPARPILVVTDWMLGKAEEHWSAEANRHKDAMNSYKGTSMGDKASAAYQEAFDNWFMVRTMRQRLRQPIRLIGGKHVECFRGAA